MAFLFALAGCDTPGESFLQSNEPFPQRYALDEAVYEVTDSSDILILYIGTRNCPPCFRYKARDYPVWTKSLEYQEVRYRELEFPRFQRTDEDRYWPRDLRWVREQAYTQRGAPRWVVAVDGRIVANLRSWNDRAYPLVQRLVARKYSG